MKIWGIMATLVIIFALAFVFSSYYTVSEREQAVVTSLGKPVKIIVGSMKAGEPDEALTEVQNWLKEKQPSLKVKVICGAGLYFKKPFMDTVHVFDDRLLAYDSAPTDIVTKDKKHLFVDTYARWRILNPLLFLQTVSTENGAQARLDDIIYSVVREELGKSELYEIVRSTNDPILTEETRLLEEVRVGRAKILEEIAKGSREKAKDYGIQIVDVRLRRADLPTENAESIFQRMIAERVRIAMGYRSEGEREAVKIRAETDLQANVIRTNAYREAERVKGQGDSEALKTYAEAYQKNPEFFQLWRTLDSYDKAFLKGSTKVVMPIQGSNFNKFLLSPR